MPRIKKAGRAAAKSSTRDHGGKTRQRLLDVAGRVFAEQSYSRATSKEICERAGANIAAVNYHFGGKEGLYSAVLEEAHARLVSIDLVTQTTQGGGTPAEKLRTLLGHVINEIAQRDEGSWELRVLSREVQSPTSMSGPMIANQIKPKLKLVAAMIADVLGVSANHPAVSRCMVSIIGPCGFLLLTDPAWQKQVFPALTVDPQTLVDHMVAFAMGGLNAVATTMDKPATKRVSAARSHTAR